MQFRLTTHPNDSVTAAVSIENPDQYVGSGVRLPAGLPSGEVDTGATVNDVPNPFPDIIGKVAFDPKIGRTHQHIDAALLVRNFKTYNLDTDTTFNKTAIGGELTAAVEPISSIRLVATGFYSSGGGRYIANTNLPDFIVNHDASMTLVTTWSSLIGTEIQAGSKTNVYAYYSAAHADRAVATDVDGSAIGFGVPGSHRGERTASPKRRQASPKLFFATRRSAASSSWRSISHVRRTPFSVPAWHAGRRVCQHDLFERPVFPAMNVRQGGKPMRSAPNAGQALRAALRTSQGYRRVLCVRPLVSLQPLSGKSRAAF